ncbi:uncharacterized protein LOC131326386 [Rhododendron vialii]|uniref:uncharacterized protein LOC131326386 n=1 Tax=Rhododendron vialii TaxID=182163 RepID=UPI00265E5FCC|nr:uncharacterized protein LOC131326386 [Rhododendron vialii]
MCPNLRRRLGSRGRVLSCTFKLCFTRLDIERNYFENNDTESNSRLSSSLSFWNISSQQSSGKLNFLFFVQDRTMNVILCFLNHLRSLFPKQRNYFSDDYSSIMEKQGYGYFPDDCWELIFQKLREDDERDLDSISSVSKRFLSISNRVKHSLNVNAKMRHLLPHLLRRFQHIKSIVICFDFKKDVDGLFNQIARSGVLNLLAIWFLWNTTEPPRDGFRALALNKNINNYLKVLDCSGLCSMQDKDLVLIADLFPRIEELRLRTDAYICNDGVARITDDGIDALSSKLKELKEIEFTGYACFITDQSLISLSTNCAKLRKISLCIYSSCQHYVAEDGIDFVVRHSPNLTSLSLELWSLQHFASSFAIGNALANAKNLHSLPMTQELISDNHICLVAKACTPLRKLKLVGFSGHMLIDTGRANPEKLGPLKHGYKRFGSGQEIDNFSPDPIHKNYRLRHLDISDNMWVNDTTLDNFGQVCPNLQFLGVSDCQPVTSLGIGEVLRRCPAIRQLNIDCLQVSDIFGRYSDKSVVNLKTLKAGGTQINDKGMAMIGHRCRNLQYLDIGFCNEVTDKGVMEVVRWAKRLRNINQIGCEKVSTHILPQMVFLRPSLRKS